MSSSDDDLPLSLRRPAASVPAAEESSDDDVPLSLRPVRGARVSATANAASGASEESEEDDSDDDVPLAARAARNASVSRLKRKRPSDSAVRAPTVKRESKSVSKKGKKRASDDGPSRKKKRTPKKEADRDRKPKKEKKESASTPKFEMKGQRRETPLKNDPTRMFYASMYHEKKKLQLPSEIAETWMLRHGLLSADDAQDVMKRLKLKN